MSEPDKQADPNATIIRGQNGESYLITPTERGLTIVIGEGYRLIYTSVIAGMRNIRFEVERTASKKILSP